MRRIILFAASCLMLAACTKSEINTPAFKKGQVVTISASAGVSESTKVTGKDNGTQIDFKWEEGDKVLVKVGEASSEFTVKSGTISADGKSADFEGEMPAEGSSYDVQYPVPSDTDPLKNQTYVEGGIASGLMQFGAEGCTSSKITLQPKTAILQLNLYTLTGKKSEGYWEYFPINPISTISVKCQIAEAQYTDIWLDVDPAVTIGTSESAATPFFIVIPAGYTPQTVTCSLFTKDFSNPSQLSAGTCINMPAIEVSWSEYCLAAGTRITMADGSTKKVENIAEGDLLRTFDHEAGCISSAKCCMTYKSESKATSLNLTFASGKKLAIVGTHDLLLENTRKYVRINSGNVASFVGKRFYNAESGKWDTLVSYATGSPVDYYCIYTAKQLNCIAEGLLTCPDDVDFCLNIYELDAKLKADAAQLAADIAQYGLMDVARDFPEFAQYQSQMENLGCKYVYIAIGKGLIPESYIETMKSYWLGK